MQRHLIMEKKNLPEQVIREILLRLPVKSLLRFRCVSKSWLSLISNPHFANLHFQRSSQHTHRILHTVASGTRSLDFNASLHDDSAVVSLNFPLFKPLVHVHIMGSCRGFLLLVLDYDPKLFIWNPSTGVCKHIPPSSLQNYIFLYGFGYDASTDDYLVVLASCDPNAYDCATDVEIFSLRTNSWKKVEGNYPYISRMDDPEPLSGSFLNGAIHWLASRLEEQVSNEVMIAFDLTERNFREVPMPDGFKYGSCELKVLGGCLGLIDENGYEEIEIWVMREYGVRSSWSMHITVSLVEIPTKYFSPICFTKDGEIVGIDGSLGLVKCNDKGEVLEHRQYCHDPLRYRGTASVYTETLLSLPTDQDSSSNQPSCFSP